jgi:hypothetical protein
VIATCEAVTVIREPIIGSIESYPYVSYRLT